MENARCGGKEREGVPVLLIYAIGGFYLITGRLSIKST
jgi:hypothetical protein